MAINEPKGLFTISAQITEADRKMLMALCEKDGDAPVSAVLRRLIRDAYSSVRMAGLSVPAMLELADADTSSYLGGK